MQIISFCTISISRKINLFLLKQHILLSSLSLSLFFTESYLNISIHNNCSKNFTSKKKYIKTENNKSNLLQCSRVKIGAVRKITYKQIETKIKISRVKEKKNTYLVVRKGVYSSQLFIFKAFLVTPICFHQKNGEKYVLIIENNDKKTPVSPLTTNTKFFSKTKKNTTFH